MSPVKAASLIAMQLSKIATKDNNNTNPSLDTHQQYSEDSLNPEINPLNISLINNISCMDEDKNPRHLSHNNSLDAQMANEVKHLPSTLNTPNPIKISSLTSNQIMQIDSIITTLPKPTSQNPISSIDLVHRDNIK